MTETIEIQPSGPVRGTVRPPGSKSITNRALVCAALAQGDSTLRGALDSEDTRVMIDALRALGLAIEHDRAAAELRVVGCGGEFSCREADLFVGNSGTTVRFLTAMLTLGRGTFRLDGTPRMRQRPIEDLLDALRQLGADAQSQSGTGCPPVVVRARGLPGGKATVAGNICTASPCADMVLALVCLEAELTLTSLSSSRQLPLQDFLLGPGETAIKPGELVSEIIVPRQPNRAWFRLEKLGNRNAMTIATASMALRAVKRNGRLEKVSIAWGSVAPTTVRSSNVEQVLEGEVITPAGIRTAVAAVADDIRPINDHRASAAYRLEVCQAYLQSALEDIYS